MRHDRCRRPARRHRPGACPRRRREQHRKARAREARRAQPRPAPCRAGARSPRPERKPRHRPVRPQRRPTARSAVRRSARCGGCDEWGPPQGAQRAARDPSRRAERSRRRRAARVRKRGDHGRVRCGDERSGIRLERLGAQRTPDDRSLRCCRVAPAEFCPRGPYRLRGRRRRRGGCSTGTPRGRRLSREGVERQSAGGFRIVSLGGQRSDFGRAITLAVRAAKVTIR